VLQGSVLGPQLLIIYINDLQAGTECNIATFEDDTKIVGKADSEEDIKISYTDMDRVGAWAKI